jgi:hypothetical protein
VAQAAKLEKTVAGLTGRLAAPSFVGKAPAAVVEGVRAEQVGHRGGVGEGEGGGEAEGGGGFVASEIWVRFLGFTDLEFQCLGFFSVP